MRDNKYPNTYIVHSNHCYLAIITVVRDSGVEGRYIVGMVVLTRRRLSMVTPRKKSINLEYNNKLPLLRNSSSMVEKQYNICGILGMYDN